MPRKHMAIHSASQMDQNSLLSKQREEESIKPWKPPYSDLEKASAVHQVVDELAHSQCFPNSEFLNLHSLWDIRALDHQIIVLFQLNHHA